MSLRSGGAIPVSLIQASDDRFATYGDGDAASFGWETADANANVLLLSLPEGGATDVPIFVIGDATILNADLGFFDGLTEPAVAVIDDDGDSYIKTGFVSDDVAEILSNRPIEIASDGATSINISGGVTPTFSFAGVTTIDTSGNALLTLTGGTAGVRFDNTIGIGIAPTVNSLVRAVSAITPSGNLKGVEVNITATLVAAKDGIVFDVDGTLTENTSGTHSVIAGIRINAFSVADGGGSEVVTNLAGLYIAGAPIAGTTPVNGPYAAFLDSGDMRIDDRLGMGAGPIDANADIWLLGNGSLAMKEITTPTATTNYGKIYTKNTNKLFFQDGAGTEHELAFV